MTESSRRQVLLLGVVLVVLAAVVVWQMSRTSESGPAGSPARTSNQPVRPGTSAAVVDVKIASLQREATELPPAERNPFRFEQKAPPPPPPRQTAPAVATRPVAPVPQGPPPPPPITLRLIGMLGQVAVLRDTAGNPIYGKEGDIIEGRYRLLRVTADSVEIAYLDGRGRQMLRLTTPQ